MAIFRKKIKRSADVVVAIEAETEEKADEIFKDWIKDSECELSDTLAEKEQDEEEWIASFSNQEEYNRIGDLGIGVLDDFFISEAERKKEPVYDLYLLFNDNPAHKIRKVWEGIDMKRMLDIIGFYNKEYTIHPELVPDYKCYLSAHERNAHVVVYRCEGRSNDV